MGGYVKASALAYAARGWPVLPLFGIIDGRCGCGRNDCESPGKHPHGQLAPHGLDDASTDVDTVTGWWVRVPNLNVGLRTGVTFDVLDLDSPTAGTWLACYAVVQGADTVECWRAGPMSHTGKGSHLLYAPAGAGNRARINGIDGFDWRGKGGYIVAPPSMHASGQRYRWVEGCGPDAPIPPAPDFLVELVAGKSHRAAAPVSQARVSAPSATGGGWSPAGLVGRVATATNGERNNLLNWAAAKIGADVRSHKVAETEAIAGLEQLAVAAERAGLGATEVERTIRSGYRAGLDGRAA